MVRENISFEKWLTSNPWAASISENSLTCPRWKADINDVFASYPEKTLANMITIGFSIRHIPSIIRRGTTILPMLGIICMPNPTKNNALKKFDNGLIFPISSYE